MSRFSSTKERHMAIKNMLLLAANQYGVILPVMFMERVAGDFDILLREAREAAIKELE